MGVAKAGAHIITLSGFEGGTGAARSHALKYAGMPVEFGVNYAGIRYLKEGGALSPEAAEELEAGAVPEPYAVPIPRKFPRATVEAAHAALAK